MVQPLSLQALDRHFTTLVVNNPLSYVLYSTALKVFGLFLRQLHFPFNFFGVVLFISSFALEIKVVENWRPFKVKFLDNLDHQISKAEQKTLDLISTLKDVGMRQAVSHSVAHPWPITVNFSRGVYSGASSIVRGTVGGVRNWCRREPPVVDKVSVEEKEETESESSGDEYDDLDDLNVVSCSVM